VDLGKRRKLVHAAQLFLGEHREYAHASCRFNVVEAHGDPQAPQITWLRDAFRADDV
jgi:putative endonuclease